MSEGGACDYWPILPADVSRRPWRWLLCSLWTTVRAEENKLKKMPTTMGGNRLHKLSWVLFLAFSRNGSCAAMSLSFTKAFSPALREIRFLFSQSGAPSAGTRSVFRPHHHPLPRAHAVYSFPSQRVCPGTLQFH